MHKACIRIGMIAATLATAGTVLAAPASVDELLAKKVAVLRILHGKAKKALVNAAQDHTFERYFTSEHAHHRRELKDRIDRIALAVQDRSHTEEMCLIDPNGHEISRIVGDRIAHDLSQDEAAAPFFKPGFAHPPRSVLVSPIYLSVDAHKWVVAYVTPVIADGNKRAILHFERGLDVYQAFLTRDLAATDARLLAVDRRGYIVVDSARQLPVIERDDARELGDYFEIFAWNGLDLAAATAMLERGGALTSADGTRWRGAHATVEDWTLLVLSPASEFAP